MSGICPGQPTRPSPPRGRGTRLVRAPCVAHGAAAEVPRCRRALYLYIHSTCMPGRVARGWRCGHLGRSMIARVVVFSCLCQTPPTNSKSRYCARLDSPASRQDAWLSVMAHQRRPSVTLRTGESQLRAAVRPQTPRGPRRPIASRTRRVPNSHTEPNGQWGSMAMACCRSSIHASRIAEAHGNGKRLMTH